MIPGIQRHNPNAFYGLGNCVDSNLSAKLPQQHQLLYMRKNSYQHHVLVVHDDIQVSPAGVWQVRSSSMPKATEEKTETAAGSLGNNWLVLYMLGQDLRRLVCLPLSSFLVHRS